MSKKKAGIVAAVSAAAMLALSPLAFAGDMGVEGLVGGESASEQPVEHGPVDKHAEGAVAGANGNNISVPVTVCNNDVTGGAAGGAAKDITGGAAGAGSFFGDSKAKTEVNDEDNRACVTESDAGDNR